jgi:predicted MFS family arabinose efflux permease
MALPPVPTPQFAIDLPLLLWRAAFPMVLWSTGLYSVYTYLGAGLAAEGFSTGQTAAAILFYGCGAIVGVLVGGRVADRLGLRFTATASFAGLCACLLLLRLALDAQVSRTHPRRELGCRATVLSGPASRSGK